MKKLNKAKNQIRVRIANRRWRISVDRRLKYDLVAPEITINGPSVLSFSTNGAETIEFFDLLKSTTLARAKKIRRNGKYGRQSIFVDFSTIARISLPSAVILSAELHRWSILKHTKLSPKKLDTWNPRVRRLLIGLGSFDLLGIAGQDLSEVDEDETITILPLSSGEKNDGQKIDQLQKELVRLGTGFNSKKYIFDGLGEAVTNAIEHGYKSETTVAPKYPYAGHRWWATSCYDPAGNCLRFFVYDQGVGIARTLQIDEDWAGIVNLVKRLFSNPTDADYIVGAFEIGKSSTGESGRGRGLDQILGVIRQAGMGNLRVLSGAGDVTFDTSGKASKRQLISHIGGTLIEWSVPIAALS